MRSQLRAGELMARESQMGEEQRMAEIDGLAQARCSRRTTHAARVMVMQPACENYLAPEEDGGARPCANPVGCRP